jgi:hypothetical protein
VPRVPTYGGPQVGRSPLPGVRVPGQAPAGAFQPVQPIDISGVQQALAREVDRARQQADQLTVLEADNQIARLETDLRISALNRRGKDALGATADIEDEWRKGVSEIEKGIAKSDRQRRAVAARASGRWAQLYETIERHAAGEANRYDDETTKAALATRINDATANYADERAVALALIEAKAIVTDYATRNGLSPEVRDEQVADTVSAIHTGVLNRMLSAGDDRQAQAYYTAAKKEIRGDDAARIEKALQASSTLAASQREVDVILSTKDVTRESAFQKARGIADPEVRRETEQLLDVEFARRDRARRDIGEKRFKQAFDYANQGRRPPAPLWSTLEPNEQVSIDQRIKQVTGGGPEQTDWDLYYKLTGGAATNPEAFAKINLLEARSRLGETEWKELVRIQNAIKGGSSEEVSGLITEREIREEAVDKLYPKNNKPGDDQDRANQFRRDVDADLKRWKEANPGKKIPSEDFQSIVDARTVRSVFVPRESGTLRVPRLFGQFGIARVTVPGIGSTQRELGEVEEDERGRAYVPTEQIPPASLDEIRNEIRQKSGHITSSRQVERAFAAWLMGDRALYNTIVREGASP